MRQVFARHGDEAVTSLATDPGKVTSTLEAAISFDLHAVRGAYVGVAVWVDNAKDQRIQLLRVSPDTARKLALDLIIVAAQSELEK
jgi:hypothetical protein